MKRTDPIYNLAKRTSKKEIENNLHLFIKNRKFRKLDDGYGWYMRHRM